MYVSSSSTVPENVGSASRAMHRRSTTSMSATRCLLILVAATTARIVRSRTNAFTQIFHSADDARTPTSRMSLGAYSARHFRHFLRPRRTFQNRVYEQSGHAGLGILYVQVGLYQQHARFLSQPKRKKPPRWWLTQELPKIKSLRAVRRFCLCPVAIVAAAQSLISIERRGQRNEADSNDDTEWLG